MSTVEGGPVNTPEAHAPATATSSTITAPNSANQGRLGLRRRGGVPPRVWKLIPCHHNKPLIRYVGPGQLRNLPGAGLRPWARTVLCFIEGVKYELFGHEGDDA